MIRQLHAKDVGIFRQIRLEALRCDPGAFASYLHDWEKMQPADWARILIDEDVFVSFEGKTPVGIMGIIPFSPAKKEHRGTISLVYLNAKYRGQGRAAALLRALEDHAMQKGLGQLELEVSSDQTQAINFYERMGYHRIGLVPAGFRHKGRETELVLMQRRLAS